MMAAVTPAVAQFAQRCELFCSESRRKKAQVNTNRHPSHSGGVNKNRELGVVLAVVHRVWPLARPCGRIQPKYRVEGFPNHFFSDS
jgi:hypothetical protein